MRPLTIRTQQAVVGRVANQCVAKSVRLNLYCFFANK